MNFARLKQFMDDLEKDYCISGAAVAVIHKEKEVFRCYAGVMNEKGEPVSEKTLYRLYSMTKPVTAVAAMQLLEKGRYKLDDQVGKYLPEFYGMKVARLKPNGSYGWWDQPAKEEITIRHLLTMTSGLTYGGLFNPAEIKTLEAQKKLEQDTGFDYTSDQFYKMIATCPLMFDPGAHWNYSYSMDVVGVLIEKISGMSLGEYFKKNIFEPLGMQDMCFFLKEEDKNRLMDYDLYNGCEKIKTYSETDRPLYTGKSFESGGAGLIGSLDDYLKFAYCMSHGGRGENGRRILSSAAIDLMRTNCLNEEQLKSYDWEALRGYGYGLGVRTMMNRTAGGALSNVGEFGWNGLAGCYFLADPKEELAIVYMQQRDPNLEGDIQPRLRNIVYGCLAAD